MAAASGTRRGVPRMSRPVAWGFDLPGAGWRFVLRTPPTRSATRPTATASVPEAGVSVRLADLARPRPTMYPAAKIAM